MTSKTNTVYDSLEKYWACEGLIDHPAATHLTGVLCESADGLSKPPYRMAEVIQLTLLCVGRDPRHGIAQVLKKENSKSKLTENGINLLAPGKCGNNFKIVISNSFYELIPWAFPEKLLRGECHRTPLMIINIGSGNGLVPSGNKPLPDPMLTQIYVPIWRHQATMS